jgi:hypothetical protein
MEIAMKIFGLVILLALSGCFHEDPGFAIQQQADFFECPPNNHLVACTPGTTLTGCEPVGNGLTTKDLIDCQ